MLTSVVLCCLVSLVASSSYGEDHDLDVFVTKTSYFAVGNTDVRNPVPEECSLKLFWHLARHGTRYPDAVDITAMIDNLPLFRNKIVEAAGEGNLPAEVIEDLKTWTFDLTEDDGAILTEAGKLEHKEMGQRWKARLDGLVKFNPESIQAISSTKARAKESGEAFIEGLGQTFEIENADDHLLRFYSECPNYITNVMNYPPALDEQNEFVESTAYLEMQIAVEEMTGVEFSLPDIELMYNICRFEVAWFPGNWSVWCNLFTSADLRKLEFKEDLGYFYQSGPKYSITKEMTQPLWNDLLTRMIDVMVHGDIDKSEVLLFAHSDTLMPFIDSLGLFEDSKDLLASDWPAEDRLWRTSRICPFATNVDVMLLNCPKESGEADLRVILFHQEKQVEIPGLGMMPTFTEFGEQYNDYSSADFNTVCKV